MNAARTNEVIVAIGDQKMPVGIIRFATIRNKQLSSFRYLDEWLQDPASFALAPSLPRHDQWTHFASHADDAGACLPGIVSDCAPDAWGKGVISRAAGRQLNEFQYLLAVDDVTRQGALRLLDENGTPLANDVPPTPGLTDLGRLQRLTAMFAEGVGDLSKIAHELRGAGSSLGGARPKSVIADPEGNLHVAKYTMERDTMPVERAEVATLALARDVGIRAAGAALAMADTRLPIALIRRFDRGKAGKGRVHYMSAQSLLGKHRGEPAYYTDIADGLRAVCSTDQQALAELAELHRRILFTILVSNNDDHLKNHGLLYTGERSWALSPAFDINPQPLRHPHLKTGISPLSGFEASVEAWVEAAPYFEVSEDQARDSAVAMAKKISARWRDRFIENGITEAQCREYSPAFDHSEMTIALRMQQPKGSPQTARLRKKRDEGANPEANGAAGSPG